MCHARHSVSFPLLFRTFSTSSGRLGSFSIDVFSAVDVSSTVFFGNPYDNSLASPPSNNLPLHRPLKLLAPHRHLQWLKRIPHHKLRIHLIQPLTLRIDHLLLHIRFPKDQELDASGRLVAAHEEARGLQAFDAGGVARDGDGGELAGDGVDAVEGAGEDEVVVAGEGEEVRGTEGAVVD